MPLFIILRTLKWQKQATGLKYFIVFIHHSIFRLPPLEGTKTKQPPIFFIRITGIKMDRAHMVDVVQSACLIGLAHGLQFNIQNVRGAFCICFRVSE